MRLVVDRPRVARHAGARREAGHQRVEMLAAEAVAAQRRAIGDVAEAQRRAGEPLRQGFLARPVVGPPPQETHDVVTAGDERARRRLPDRA
jgi:hypothetical protein